MTTPLTFQINTSFVPRIVAAFRGIYPDITSGLNDGTAVKACIINFIRDTVSEWEALQIAGSYDSISLQFQQSLAQRQQKFDAQKTQSATDTNGNIT